MRATVRRARSVWLTEVSALPGSSERWAGSLPRRLSAVMVRTRAVERARSDGVRVDGTVSSWSTDTYHASGRRWISDLVVNHGARRV